MKRVIPLFVIFCVLAAAPAWPADIDININVGAPAVVPITIPEPPLFLVPRALGFQVAVGVSYDLFRVAGRFYLFSNNVWRVGSGYNGPWQVIRHDHLPRGLRTQRLHDIRTYRDHEYVVYKRDQTHYRGKSYRPERYDHDRDGHGHSQAQNNFQESDKRAAHGHGRGHGKEGKGWM